LEEIKGYENFPKRLVVLNAYYTIVSYAKRVRVEKRKAKMKMNLENG
jgi:hypothetical protein